MNKFTLVGKEGLLSKIIQKNFEEIEIYYRGSESQRFDLSDPNTFKANIENSIVLFTSSISSPQLCYENFNECFRINVINTCNAIESLLRRNNYVLFCSSDSVYGESLNGKVFSENDDAFPNNDYGLMKRVIERYFESNENFISLRFSYIFNGEDKFSKYCIDNDAPEIFTGFKRNVVDDKHICKVINYLLQNVNFIKKNKTINIIGDQCIDRVGIIKNLIKLGLISNDKNFKYVNPPKSFFKYRARCIETSSIFREQFS